VKRLALFILLIAACAEELPLNEPGEKLYPLRGTIVSRSGAHNELRIEHEQIPGYMAAMTMDFPVRGASVESLPPNGSHVEASLHVTPSRFWLTDVRLQKPPGAAGS
jgi:protein SCO1/2